MFFLYHSTFVYLLLVYLRLADQSQGPNVSFILTPLELWLEPH